MEVDASSFSGHKLCGFLCAVLKVTSPEHPNLRQTLPFGTRFQFSQTDVNFTSQQDVVLSPIGEIPNAESSFNDKEQCEDVPVRELGKKRKAAKVSKKNGMRKGRSIGLVRGNISVVCQLHALVMNKCLMIDARFLGAEAGVNGEVRAVLLVDVYLPIALLSGWQFPKYGSLAGALFRHLSSDWGDRSAMLINGDHLENTLGANRIIWNLSYCHVFGCKLHHNFTETDRLFELHEIFKSLPSVEKTGKPDSSRIQSCDSSHGSGIWEISDDILLNILAVLSPIDLVRVSATCRRLRLLACSVMPCMKLKLFPHQQAAVAWMLRRERNADVLPHPLYVTFSTEDGFSFYINTISGDIVTGVAPTVNDFHGGMFCDEPGLGKTITSLSLILKTQGTLPNPPDGVHVNWCMHNGSQKCGYYELNGDYVAGRNIFIGKREMALNTQSFSGGSKYHRPKRARLLLLGEEIPQFSSSCPGPSGKSIETPVAACFDPEECAVQCSRSLSCIRKNLFSTFEGESSKAVESSSIMKHASNDPGHVSRKKQGGRSHGNSDSHKKPRKVNVDKYDYNDTWVQCDACRKWRKLPTSSIGNTNAAWFCSMNADPFYQSCSAPEESWDNFQPITHLLGFYTKGASGGEERNVSFFISVLKEHYAMINSLTKKALNWLAKLSLDKLSAMETIGIESPFCRYYDPSGDHDHGFQIIFKAFGLKTRVERGVNRWYYPRNLENMSFDVAALKIALCAPLDTVRLYLSRATLIVVPSNLVDHWNTQIQKHVRPGQLRVYIWVDHRKPSAHSLAWEYDVVITTFNRLSAEWGPRKKSLMRQVHWLRVMLDEGHTLGSSLSLTNKMQMAVSMMASNRWILTGTPTPNTPNSQLSHLQPLLKFLHEEAYGLNYRSWEAGILRPFEAKMEEGRSRLLHLLHRCMISAKKMDMKTIPPCIKRVTYLDFTEQHATSYNELVVTVRRNILMADWNDPSHVESLLNPKQWKLRSTTIGNVRLSCCVAGHIKVTDAGQDIQETMDILVENGLDPASEEYACIRYNLIYGGNCVRCKEWCRLPVITPCRHLLCLDCVALDSERCTYPGCGNLYEMQTPDTLTRPENPNPKWAVPKDLIELQPSYNQDKWNPDWQSTSSSKVTYIVEKLKALQEANRKTDCSPINNDNALHTENLLISDSKGLFQVHVSKMSTKTHDTKLEKVLVFSQFLEHIHVIEQQLTIAGIKYAGMYSPMHSINKIKSLGTFQHDASCTVLLMDGSAALGLDLSFVTHVFLMEPIWDRSMEEQVVSRAHRMGATRPIHVETLAMRGTIEEQMMEFLQDADECRRILKEEIGKSDPKGARTQRSLHDFAESNYLSHLSFVRTNHKF